MSLKLVENYNFRRPKHDIIDAQDVKYGVRHVQVVLMFAIMAIQNAQRAILSVAIVAMVDKSSDHRFQIFQWDAGQQSYVLSSFYWGHVLTQVPSGPLAQRCGVKILLLVSTLSSSILAILTPFGTSIGGWKLLCGIQVATGIMQGCLGTCFGIFVTKWIPIPERGKLVAFCYSGYVIGTITSMSIGGVIVESFGWPSIFYVVGAAGLVWSIFWICFGGETPNGVKYISTEEVKLINDSCGLDLKTHSELAIPWKKILTSVPVLSLMLTEFCSDWGLWFFSTNIPTYMKNVLNFDIKNNGLLSALPYTVKFIFTVFVGFMADFLINKNYVKLGTSRKIFSSVALLGPSVALLGIVFVPINQTVLVVVLLTLGVAISAAGYVSIHINHVDLSSNFAGVLMGITNTMSTLAGIISPLVAGIVINDKENIEQWQIMFFITAGVYLVGNFTFFIFGNATVQTWNSSNSSN